MEEYARRMNVERWRRELESETDPSRRAMLQRLLDDELQQLERLLAERGQPRG